MKRLVVLCIALAASMSAAAAADLPMRAPEPYYKAPLIAAPIYNWTGFYVGLNGGGAFGRSNWDSTGGFNTSGGLIGGTVGYNYQIGAAVIGAEGDIDWSRISGTITNGACPFGCQTSDTWLSTIRGRLGYAAGRFMPYVTGGLALGDIRASAPGFAGNNSVNAGWTIGAGIEMAVVGNLTAKAEYLFVDLGNFNCGFGCGLTTSNNVSFSANIVRGGLNYRF